MIYELRTYDIAPGRMKPAVDRIVDHAAEYLKKHGIRPVAYWEPVIGTSPQLIYMLEWDNLADRERKWDAYVSDPGWTAARVESERDGPIVVRTTNLIVREVAPIMTKLRSLR